MTRARTGIGLFALIWTLHGVAGAADAAGWVAKLREEATRSTMEVGLESSARELEDEGKRWAAKRLRALAVSATAERPIRPAEAILARVLSGTELARRVEALKPLRFTVEPASPYLLLREEVAAYRGTLCAAPATGYDPVVAQLDPAAPHSMESPWNYIRHHTGDHVLTAAREWGWRVELHSGPAGLALRSVRQRGFGQVHLLNAPALGLRRSDGFAAAFLSDGSPLLVYTGAMGRDRYLHAQAMLRLAGVPGERVRRFEHGFRSSDVVEGLEIPAGSSEDVAAIGFSPGPVKSLLRQGGSRAESRPFEIGASFLEPRALRFRDRTGRWRRLLLLGGLWGDVAREAGRRLAELGYKRLLVFGIAGGLSRDARLGEIQRPAAVAGEDGDLTGQLSRWLRLPAGTPVREARVVGTYSPLSETLSQLETWRREGWTTVEMELPRFLQGVRDSGQQGVRVDALSVVSDLPAGGAGQTLESRYHHRGEVARAGDRCVRWLLDTLGATRVEPVDGPFPRRRRRIGIYTGTFDPPHAGHLGLARQAVQQLRLDRLYMVPNAVTPHKPNATPFRGRCEMLWASIQQDRTLDMLADPEVRRTYAAGGPLDSNRLLQRRLGRECDYVQVMGADSFLSLSKQAQHLSAALVDYPICVFLRHGTADAEVRQAAARAGSRVIVLDDPSDTPSSSTTVRALLRDGKPVHDWLPAATERVARRWRLYQARPWVDSDAAAPRSTDGR